MAEKIIGYGKGTFEDRNGKQVKWAKLYCLEEMKETHTPEQTSVGFRSYSLPVDYGESDKVFSEILTGEEHECMFNRYGKVVRVFCGDSPF